MERSVEQVFQAYRESSFVPENLDVPAERPADSPAKESKKSKTKCCGKSSSKLPLPDGNKSIFSMSFEIDGITKPRFCPKVGSTAADLVTNFVKTIQCTNTVVIVDGFRFHCHSEVLICFSRFFAGHQRISCIDLENRTTAIGFDMAYRWMLTSAPQIQRSFLAELFQTAVVLQIPLLIESCWSLFSSKNYFTEDQAFLMYLEAKPFDAETAELQLHMLNSISKMFLAVVTSADYLMMSLSDVCCFLSSNQLAVNSEMEVMYSAFRWICFNWPEREPHALQVFSCVRFKLLSPFVLTSFNANHPMFIIRKLVEQESFVNTIRDAIQYSSIVAIHGNRSEEAAQLLNRCGQTVPANRKWLYDKYCDYHHVQSCINSGNFSVENFLSYLEMIAKRGLNWDNFEDINANVTGMKECCVKSQRRAIKH